MSEKQDSEEPKEDEATEEMLIELARLARQDLEARLKRGETQPGFNFGHDGED